MQQLLISDTNILIDLEEGELIATLFLLPYDFQVPDILYAEELEEQHGYLLSMGLSQRELSPETLTYAQRIMQNSLGPSRNDCFALALARQENCPLLTGDKALRTTALTEAIDVRGTIWVVEELIRYQLITPEQAHQTYTLMQARGRRLPWAHAFKRLETFASKGQ
ncbi:PIN domain-containing protein [Vreelandella sp. TE19]